MVAAVQGKNIQSLNQRDWSFGIAGSFCWQLLGNSANQNVIRVRRRANTRVSSIVSTKMTTEQKYKGLNWWAQAKRKRQKKDTFMSFQYRKIVASDLINDAKETWAGPLAPWPHSRSSSIWQRPQSHQPQELVEPMLRHQPSCKGTIWDPNPATSIQGDISVGTCLSVYAISLTSWHTLQKQEHIH